MKKQFFRVKQLADQTFLKADKSEVLNHEELQIADQKVEYLRGAITAINKRIPASGQANDIDKRAKKCLEYHLAHVFLEQGNRKNEQTLSQEEECSLFQSILRECGHVEQNLAKEYIEHEIKVEEMVSQPLQALLENEFPNILKQKRNLSKYILDKDSASNRYHSTKKEALRDDMEEADTKVEQSRDALAYEMFGLLSRENELSSYILQLLKLQRGYHESALKNLECVIPELERKIGDSSVKRVFGTSLQEHLRVTGKKIAYPLEICITVLTKIGMSEEGLFRIAGGMSRVKRLKAAIDSGCLNYLIPEYQDVHVLASTLKMYLRELPEPLLTYYLHNEWMQSMQYPENQRLEIVKKILLKLPMENYDNLSYLIRFLAKLSRHSENKMTSSNIAIVIAPNLLWGKDEESNMNMGNCTTANMLVEMFIKEVDQLFPDDVGKYVNLPINLLQYPEENIKIFHNNDEIDLNTSMESIQTIDRVIDSPKPNSRKKKTAAPVPPNNNIMSKTDQDIDRVSSLPTNYPSGSSTLTRPKAKEFKVKMSVGVNTDENSLSIRRSFSEDHKESVTTSTTQPASSSTIVVSVNNSGTNTSSTNTPNLITHKEPKVVSLVNLDNTKIVEHKYITQPSANIQLSKAKPVQQIIAQQNIECDNKNINNFKITETHFIENHCNNKSPKPIAKPRSLIINDEKLNNKNNDNNIMSKSVELCDVQLRHNKPEVPARPASLKRPQSDLHLDPTLHRTQCSVYSVANKQQPSIVNIQNRSEKYQLGHDNQMAEKEKFLGHDKHKTTTTEFNTTNNNNNNNNFDKAGLPPKIDKHFTRSNERINVGKSNERLNLMRSNEKLDKVENGNSHLSLGLQQHHKSSHTRTRSDGNIIDLSESHLLQTPPSPRSLNKPTEPPPPPPVTVKKEPDSTDL